MDINSLPVNVGFTLLKYFVNKNFKYELTKNTKSKNLNSLQILIFSSNEESVKEFLKNNIIFFKDEINYQNEKGWTALMMACRNSNNYSNNEIVKLLLENGADPNLKDYNGWTSLMSACRYSNTDSNIETVKLLLENGADPNLKNNNEWTALMLACRNSNTDSNTETVKLLLENGADPNLKDDDGRTALMLACRNSNTDSTPETIKILLNQNNIDVNFTTNDTKYNALMLLCQYNPNQHEIAKLLKSKTNLNHRNYKNKKIEDLCLDEYKYLFTTTLDDILQKYNLIKQECFICNEDNADTIKCEYDHYTCIKCLPRVKFNCEACRKPF